MKIEISKEDAEVLIKALELWESEASQGALMDSMMSIMLCKPDEREAERNKTEKVMKEAQFERGLRKRQSVIIQAKIFEAMKMERPIAQHAVFPGLIK